MINRPRFLLASIILLALAAGGLLLKESLFPPSQAGAADFQHLVGGLGFGPSRILSRCPFAFDPRLGRICGEEDGSLPGGSCFCPHHAGAVFYYPGCPLREK